MKDYEQKILDTVQNIYCVPAAKINLDTDFVRDLDSDSLDAIALIMELENKFKISIPDADMHKFKTIRDITQYIGRVAGLDTPAPAQNPHITPKKPDWDEIFLTIAYALASGSHCVSHQVGALLVKDRRIISTGVNGTPAGCPNCDEIFPHRPRNGEDTGFDRAAHHAFSSANEIHAEMNAILYTARQGGSYTLNGATLYCTTQPCGDCLKNLLQSGIRRIVYAEKYDLSNYSEFIKDALKKKHVELVHKPVRHDAACVAFINAAAKTR